MTDTIRKLAILGRYVILKFSNGTVQDGLYYLGHYFSHKHYQINIAIV